MPVSRNVEQSSDQQRSSVGNVDEVFRRSNQHQRSHGGCYVYIEFGIFKFPV